MAGEGRLQPRRWAGGGPPADRHRGGRRPAGDAELREDLAKRPVWHRAPLRRGRARGRAAVARPESGEAPGHRRARAPAAPAPAARAWGLHRQSRPRPRPRERGASARATARRAPHPARRRDTRGPPPDCPPLRASRARHSADRGRWDAPRRPRRRAPVPPAAPPAPTRQSHTPPPARRRRRSDEPSSDSGTDRRQTSRSESAPAPSCSPAHRPQVCRYHMLRRNSTAYRISTTFPHHPVATPPPGAAPAGPKLTGSIGRAARGCAGRPP
jgi:hypothetical protein